MIFSSELLSKTTASPHAAHAVNTLAVTFKFSINILYGLGKAVATHEEAKRC
jgi:hypothetical protein